DPEYLYYGRKTWELAIAAILSGNHLLLAGPKATGKNVLCEKPFASNLAQVKEMVEKAKEKNLFLMEALWSRFLPSIIETKKLIETGEIGTPLILQAEFGIHPPYNPESRLFNPELGGGTIPDIGIYPIFLSLLLFGEPTELKVVSTPAETGTDMSTAIIMKHQGEKISVLLSTFATSLKSNATISGTEGRIELKRMFHTPTRVTVLKENEEKEREIELSYVGNGYNYEAEEAIKCLNEKKIESDLLPHSFSLKLMELLDKVTSLAKVSGVKTEKINQGE
ncbi:MAG: Gfo/Idh/MocA family oxidoreductase, partial [Lachnospiraceae bacterium]|nr:Gfo/Idh/MocA family oxidoreductase [Lachnospiraceae bacterium]